MFKNKWGVVGFMMVLIVIDQSVKVYIKTHFLLGESYRVLGNWFYIHFIENPGMAYGITLGNGNWAKLFLTIFRIVAIAYGIYYLNKQINKQKPWVFIYCLALMISGALGNLIDSLFYGVIFDASGTIYSAPHLATLFPNSGGYGSFLMGNVVDMLHFPLIQTTLPEWLPIWGGEDFEFFSPIFNIADSCITISVFILFFLAQRNKTLFK